MYNMYKIHYNKSILYVIKPSEIESHKNSSFITSNEINVKLTNNLLTNFLEFKTNELVIANENPQLVIDKLKNKLKYIEAAGGVVQNQFEEILIIYRLNKYDLPKGKCEVGEIIEQTAIREVEEECGISNLQITEQLKSTYHIYKLNDKYILKQTFWFKMRTHKQELTPQKEEDIQSATWASSELKNEILSNTYPTLEDLVRQAFNY